MTAFFLSYNFKFEKTWEINTTEYFLNSVVKLY